VVLIALLGLVLLCLHRRKKAKKTGMYEATSAPPAELAVAQYPYEMASTSGDKYESTHAHPPPNELPAYSGQAMNSHHSPDYSRNGTEPYFPSDRATSNVQHDNSQQQASTMERRYSYPTPISPYPIGIRQESSTAARTTNAPAQFYTSPVSPDASATKGVLRHGNQNGQS